MLDSIVADVRADLPDLIAREEELRAGAHTAPPVRPFVPALTAEGLAVIAEVKRRSPSRGVIDAGLDPVAQAARYLGGGASAVSVLTEQHHFDGSPADLIEVRKTVTVPVLRKDFIVHPVQVVESRAMGADALLLIVAVLDDSMLARLLSETIDLGMTPLVEVHDEAEVRKAFRAGAEVIGVNNRDLATFETDLRTAELLAGAISTATVRIAESGIWSARDARRMAQAGYDAVLVGEALVRSEDPAALLAELRGVGS